MRIKFVHYIDGKAIKTNYEGNVKDLVKWLEPYLGGHKPRTFNGIKKILNEKYQYYGNKNFYFYDN